jgi:hypothetical protein
MQGPNVPEQVVAGAALRWVGTTFMRHHVFGVDADTHFPIEPTVATGRRESDNLLWADLNGCKAIGHLHDLAAFDGIDTYDARHGEVGRRGEYFLHRAALAYSSCFEAQIFFNALRKGYVLMQTVWVERTGIAT